MIHEAIHALATRIRKTTFISSLMTDVELEVFVQPRLDLADELDKIAHEHHADALHRNEMMFA